MTISDTQWSIIRRLFRDAFATSLHYAIATVNEDGSPHVTPVGSLILREPGKGFFFEGYLGASARNFRRDRRVCILAVHSSRWLFMKSLLLGRFVSMPAVRLTGVVGERREATAEELQLFRRRVDRYRFLKGYDLLWGQLQYVRDVSFENALPIRTGAMTRGLWPDAPDHGA